MDKEAFWAMYRPFYRVMAWLYSIILGALGLFCVVCGYWTPWLFALAPLFLALGVVINPWVVKRWRHL